jgi:hypothetical protein
METRFADLEMTPDQEAMLGRLRQLLDAPTLKDTVLRSSRIMLYLAESLRQGQHLYIGNAPSDLERVVLPELEQASAGWVWLTPRPHAWRRQLWVKGRRLLASQVWRDTLVNEMTETEAAENWDLPVEAIREIMAYCTEHADLIAADVAEEQQRLQSMGSILEAVA